MMRNRPLLLLILIAVVATVLALHPLWQGKPDNLLAQTRQRIARLKAGVELQRAASERAVAAYHCLDPIPGVTTKAHDEEKRLLPNETPRKVRHGESRGVVPMSGRSMMNLPLLVLLRPRLVRCRSRHAGGRGHGLPKAAETIMITDRTFRS